MARRSILLQLFQQSAGYVYNSTLKVLEKCLIFLISFTGVNFEAGNETRKNFGVVLVLNNIECGGKRGFLFILLFLEEKLRCKNLTGQNFRSRAAFSFLVF